MSLFGIGFRFGFVSRRFAPLEDFIDVVKALVDALQQGGRGSGKRRSFSSSGKRVEVGSEGRSKTASENHSTTVVNRSEGMVDNDTIGRINDNDPIRNKR